MENEMTFLGKGLSKSRLIIVFLILTIILLALDDTRGIIDVDIIKENVCYLLLTSTMLLSLACAINWRVIFINSVILYDTLRGKYCETAPPVRRYYSMPDVSFSRLLGSLRIYISLKYDGPCTYLYDMRCTRTWVNDDEREKENEKERKDEEDDDEEEEEEGNEREHKERREGRVRKVGEKTDAPARVRTRSWTMDLYGERRIK